MYYKIKKDISGVWRGLFGARGLRQVLTEQSMEYADTPKSVFGMESSYLSILKKDFPDLNINELKSMAENYIIQYLNCIESKSFNSLNHVSDKMNSLITTRINDLGNNSVKYDYIKTHKTVLNRYEKKGELATIKFQTSIEYVYKENNSEYKKIQDRFTTEFIYIIDEEQVSSGSKNLGLNCPNCGAPIKGLGEKCCVYCGSGIKDIVKRVWILNNISQG